jgi:anterior pharynx defective protein 1
MLISDIFLAYVSGLGFGIVSGLFQSVNILVDSMGPGTYGLHGGSSMFFVTSATLALCVILLHTFWSVIFFHGINNRSKIHLIYVILSHLFFSCITFFTRELHGLVIALSLANVILTMLFAFSTVGGSLAKLKRCVVAHQ